MVLIKLSLLCGVVSFISCVGEIAFLKSMFYNIFCKNIKKTINAKNRFKSSFYGACLKFAEQYYNN